MCCPERRGVGGLLTAVAAGLLLAAWPSIGQPATGHTAKAVHAVASNPPARVNAAPVARHGSYVLQVLAVASAVCLAIVLLTITVLLVVRAARRRRTGRLILVRLPDGQLIDDLMSADHEGLRAGRALDGRSAGAAQVVGVLPGQPHPVGAPAAGLPDRLVP